MEDSTTLSLSSSKEVALKDIQEDEYYLDISHEGLMLSLKNLRQNPFPGLRPFKTSETNVFFGRKDVTLDLITRLANRRFLAVLGASGTGKSSLVRAGLLPSIKTLPGKHGMWNVAICRPGKNPFGNLSKALSKATMFPGLDDYKIWESISTSSYGYEELYNASGTSKEFNTLIIIDQFEELFRHRKEGGITGKNDSALFVKMLIDVSKIENLNTYVMITMRSEFLGDCVQFPELVEEINNGQFLVPKLTGKQLKDAIIEPSGFSQALVETIFADRLLGEIGDNMDQLPVLQHALRRSYEEAKKHIKERGGIIVKYDDYDKIGRMESAIDQHAKELFDSLNDAEKLYCQLIFQLITDKATDGRGTRRPLSFSTIFSICKEDRRNNQNDNELLILLTKVIDKFRSDNNNFLMPPLLENVPLANELEIDISHESIMRIWKDLIIWIESEAKDADLLRQLISRQKDDYLQGETLDTYYNWINTKKDSATWALLYKPINLKNEEYIQKFKSGIYLVEESWQKKIDEIKNEKVLLEERITANQRLKNRNRNILILVIACLVSLGFAAWALTQKNKADENEKFSLISAKKAKDSADSAMQQRKLALQFADSTIRLQRELDRKQLQFLEAEKQLSEFKRDSLQALVDVNSKQKHLLLLGKDSLQKQVDINSLQKLPFYSSSFLDSSIKEKVVNQLLLPLKEKPELSAKFEIVRQSIDNAVKAEEIAPTDPNSAFFLMQKAIQLDSNFLVDIIRNDILKRYTFYKQKIEIGNLYDAVLLKSSTNKRIVFLSDFQTKIGYYKNGFLEFGKWIKDSNNEYSETSGSTSEDVVSDSDTALTRADSISVTLDSTSTDTTTYNPPSLYQAKATGLYGEDEIISFENNKLYLRNVDSSFSTKELRDSLPKNQYPTMASFSSDGTSLITDDRLGVIRFWFLNNGRISKIDSLHFQTLVKGKTPTITGLKFAPSGQEFLISLNNDSIQLWTIQKKLVQTYYLDAQNKHGSYSYHLISSMMISDSGNYISAIDDDYIPCLWSRDGKPIDSRFMHIPSENLYLDISPAGNYIFLFSNSGSYIADIQKKSIKMLYKVSTTRNSFSSTNNVASNLNRIAGGGFLSDETLLTYNSTGILRLWMTNPRLQTRNEVLNQKIIPALTPIEKYQLGLITIDDLLSLHETKGFQELLDNILENARKSNSAEDIRENLVNAQKLYGKIYNFKYSQSKESLERWTLINLLQNKLEKISGIFNYDKIIQRLQDIILLIEKSKVRGLSKKELLPILYSELSWELLFTKDYDKAYQSAKKALEYDSTNSSSIKNLALSSLLNNKFSEAEKIYLNYSDKDFEDFDLYSNGIFYNYYKDENNKNFVTYKEIFEKDLNTMSSAGIISLKDPNVSKILELLKNKN